ncbi:ThiF family adenylyltransferase [Desulfopila sp. IMCC35008]|uniref:tRNA threonylcarbamoyladenosine dehydratase n=1 Tax=Desulfopila sp. IMCC35008 TaxID=2653858 RepID=UPI0013D6E9F5|nr:tRNA threonylcarbamoyladenosine dehydratase [Desulfopila sp. IMCC35008]
MNPGTDIIKTNSARFSRTRRILGQDRFEKLCNSRVTVVGLGAVGGYVVEGLARAGIGNLRLVDFDTIQPTNINRQIFALESTLGSLKAASARNRVLDINPACHVEDLPLFAATETLDEIFTPRPDLLIDAIDALNPKVQLLAEAYRRQIPTLSSMGAALRTDPARIRLGDIFDSTNCPLAKHVRKRLRRQEIGRGITCVYSTEKVNFDYTEPNEEVKIGETPFSDRGRERNVLGSLPTLTGIFGLTLANEAIHRLTEL